MPGRELVYEPDFPDRETIQAAFKQLFGEGGKGKVKRFSHSGLRYLALPAGTILIEQNQSKQSRWAQMAREGHQIAWLMKEGRYLARVFDGEVHLLGHQARDEEVF
jgi:hypothetical protein